VEREVRRRLFSHVVRLPIRFFHATPTGDVMSRLTNDLSAVWIFLGPGLLMLVGTVISWLLAVAFMLRISPMLTGVSLLIAPAVVYLSREYGRAFHLRHRLVQESLASMNAALQENVSGIRLVKAFTLETREEERFSGECERYYRHNLAVARTSAAFHGAIGLLAGVGVALRQALKADGVAVQRADSDEAVMVMSELAPDLLLIDVVCADPFALAQRLAPHAAARAVPLALAVPDHAQTGAWPRLAAQARVASAGGELLRDELVGACYRLERALPERAGLVDHATRLYTGRYLHHCLVEEVERAWRLHRPFSIILFEPDAAARAEVGDGGRTDRLLRELADTLRRHTRSVNPICRYGPSTFAVLLAETSKESAQFVAEKLRRLITESTFAVRGFETGRAAGSAGVSVTVSGGVATFFTDGETAEDVLTAARRALRRAKQGGGNRVEAAERAVQGANRQTDPLAAGEPES